MLIDDLLTYRLPTRSATGLLPRTVTSLSPRSANRVPARLARPLRPRLPGWLAVLVALCEAGRNLVWPARCAGCGRPDLALCPDCRSALAGPAFGVPINGWPLGFQAWAATRYRGVPARLIIAWKGRGRHDLDPPLAAALAATVLACRTAAAGTLSAPLEWLLVPVPARRSARRRRGADLNLELARRAARLLRAQGVPVRVLPALRHVRRVGDQAGLGARQRRANLAGALAVRRGFEAALAGPPRTQARTGALAGALAGAQGGAGPCVIVDDIVTTGATAAEAARALAERGARVVGVCCLSVTFRDPGVPRSPVLH